MRRAESARAAACQVASACRTFLIKRSDAGDRAGCARTRAENRQEPVHRKCSRSRRLSRKKAYKPLEKKSPPHFSSSESDVAIPASIHDRRYCRRELVVRLRLSKDRDVANSKQPVRYSLMWSR